MMLRQAQKADIAAIAQIMGDWCEETSYIPSLHTRNEDLAFMTKVVATQDVVVAEQDRQVQGFIARDGPEIGQLFLAAPARGNGIGRQLLALMQARSDRLGLWCFQANDGARRFYERHGFRVSRMTNGEGNEESLPDIRYIWQAQQ